LIEREGNIMISHLHFVQFVNNQFKFNDYIRQNVVQSILDSKL